MGVVSSIRRRRHEKKAAYKAAKVHAKETAKATAKADKARDRYLQKTAGKIRAIDDKAAKRQDKKDLESAKALVAQAKSKRVTAGKVLGWVSTARVVIPVAAPLVYRAVAKLGSTPSGQGLSSLLGGFGAGGTAPGHDAVQRARIADLRNRAGASTVPDSVEKEIISKLGTLETTLKSASSDAELAAVSTELDLLDARLDAS